MDELGRQVLLHFDGTEWQRVRVDTVRLGGVWGTARTLFVAGAGLRSLDRSRRLDCRTTETAGNSIDDD